MRYRKIKTWKENDIKKQKVADRQTDSQTEIKKDRKRRKVKKTFNTFKWWQKKVFFF